MATESVPATETLNETFAKILAAGASEKQTNSAPEPPHGRTWIQLVLIGATVVLVLFVAGVLMKRSYERYLCVNKAPSYGGGASDFVHLMKPKKKRRRQEEYVSDGESSMDDMPGLPDTPEDDVGDGADPNFTEIS